MKTVGILLIAGASTRFASTQSKQLYLLNNKPVFEYPLDVFSKSKNINEIVVVTNDECFKVVEEYTKQITKPVKVILGGKTRQESVRNALKNIIGAKGDIVLIHDGARPLIDEKIIDYVINNAKTYGATTTSMPVVDTVAKKSDDYISSFINREEIVKIQTPQAFEYTIIKTAHEKAPDCSATDDCTLVQNLGYKIKLIPGSPSLHKITCIEDIKYLEGLLK